MARSPLSVLDQASGYSVKWVSSGIRTVLSTGVTSWEGHFAPASGRVAFSAGQRFGAQIGATLVTDYENELDVAHILVITRLRGEEVDERYEVKGVDAYPSSYLPHKMIYLAKYKQGSV